ncbi:hypothetical protein LOZ80_11810 [Paenibacillus sp. HWE-109]|uniref:hypothetical protein n=1 Tax=Paenibacillus sp. HWE-109 TaxID=1306526 RepID=UPI001EDE4967|nr:hypothetical protein [Paenibacillus sp. HWE-109]UKS29575.1 hypothetical protein LOZ80_11810 [Paenibacillus sp. HWE-109]
METITWPHVASSLPYVLRSVSPRRRFYHTVWFLSGFDGIKKYRATAVIPPCSVFALCKLLFVLPGRLAPVTNMMEA